MTRSGQTKISVPWKELLGLFLQLTSTWGQVIEDPKDRLVNTGVELNFLLESFKDHTPIADALVLCG